jgi:[citrate (pro-3S)-lyase] ligase
MKLARLKKKIKKIFKVENPHKKSNAKKKEKLYWIDRISCLKAKSYSIVDYFNDINLKEIVLYCKKEDWWLALLIVSELTIQSEVRVKATISPKSFKGNIWWNQSSLPKFQESWDGAEKGDTALIISPEPNKEAEKKLTAKGIKALQFADCFWDMWWRGIYARPMEKLHRENPHTPILFCFEQKIPRGDDVTETERFLRDNKITRPMVRKQVRNKEGDLLFLFDNFNYSCDELIELFFEPKSYLKNGSIVWEDYSSKMLNIVGGDRVTTDAPDKSIGNVYMFGGCIVFGTQIPDSKTMPSVLQRLINERKDPPRRVINKGRFQFGREAFTERNWIDGTYSANDVVVLVFTRSKYTVPKGVTYIPEGTTYLDLGEKLDERHKFGHMFTDQSHHINENGASFYAHNIYDALKKHHMLDERNEEQAAQAKNISGAEPNLLPEEERKQLAEYLGELSAHRPRIGSIVMNCNPFTLGHRYLIEKAASDVDKLFIFVVEEDKSIFPFKDRIDLVKKGTADLSKITVLPSGKFIISALTFVDYFGKSELQNKTIDPSMDVELFAQSIAPALGITIRFAGEEPLDAVTRQYNEAMQNILPKHGIEFHVFKRKEFDKEVISASRVRALLEQKDWEAISKLVPHTTLEYLRNFELKISGKKKEIASK